MRRFDVGLFLASFAASFACAPSYDSADDEPTPPAPIPADDASTDTTLSGNDGSLETSDCAMEPCPTKVIGESTGAPINWLALDATRVIWMTGFVEGGTNGSVFTCARTGCTKPVLIANDIVPGFLVGDGANAWLSIAFGGKGIYRVDAAGIDSMIPSVNGVFAIAPVGAELYFMSFVEGDGSSYTRTIYRWSSTGSVTKIATYDPPSAGTPVNTAAMAVAGGNVFLGSHNTGRIVACPIAGGPCADVVTTIEGLVTSTFAVSSDRLHWLGDKGKLESCATTPPYVVDHEDLATNGTPLAIAASADGQLVIGTDLGEIIECTAKNCLTTKRVLAMGKPVVAGPAANTLVVDASYVYWVTLESSIYRVMRVARRAS